MMTTDERERLRVLCKGRMPEPWKVEHHDGVTTIESPDGVVCEWENGAVAHGLPEFVVATRNSLPDALDHMDAHGKEIARLNELLVEFGQHKAGCSGGLGEQYVCKCRWRYVVAALKRKDRTDGEGL